MSKASGLVLLVAGLAAAAYVVPSVNDTGEPNAARGNDVATNSPAGERPSLDIAAVNPQPAYRSIAPVTTRTAEPVPAFSTPVVVTIAQRPSEPSAAPPRAARNPQGSRHARTRAAEGAEARRLLRRRAQRRLDASDAPGHESLHRSRQRHSACRGARRHSVRHGARPSGQGLRQALPVGPGPQRRRPLLAERHPRQRRQEGLPPAAVAQLPKSNPAPADKPAPAITGWSTVTTAAAPVPAAVPAPAVASAPTPGPPPTDGRMALAGPTRPGRHRRGGTGPRGTTRPSTATRRAAGRPGELDTVDAVPA